MSGDGVEVPVVMEQGRAALDCHRRNHAVNRMIKHLTVATTLRIPVTPENNRVLGQRPRRLWWKMILLLQMRADQALKALLGLTIEKVINLQCLNPPLKIN